MSFEIEHQHKNGLRVISLQDNSSGTSVEILPDFGALFHAFRIRHHTGSLNLIDSYESHDDLLRNISNSYKSARLSPFACRIKDATYRFGGKKYVFSSKFGDGHAIHGLLFDQPFTVISSAADPDHAKIVLAHEYTGHNPGYPFRYECLVSYSLKKNNHLVIHAHVKNLSEQVMPLVDGWHPYFTTGSKANDLYLQFYAKEIVEFDERLIPTGKLLPYHEFNTGKRLDKTELDNSFVLDFSQPQPLCTLKDEQKNIFIEFYPERSYPILQIYTPPHRNSIAIENISGAPDAFNNGLLLQELEPGKAADFETAYKIKLS